MPSQTLTSMGLLWRCYTVEMALFRLTQTTPSTPDQPIRGDLQHYSISANHKELQFLRQRKHSLTHLIKVQPHKYNPFSKSCQTDIKFGKSQNSIQIRFKACLKIHCQADEIQNRAEQLVISMTKDFHNDFFLNLSVQSDLEEWTSLFKEVGNV